MVLVEFSSKNTNHNIVAYSVPNGTNIVAHSVPNGTNIVAHSVPNGSNTTKKPIKRNVTPGSTFTKGAQLGGRTLWILDDRD